jgi:t-SNARE complex subunit (syntaxin)
MRANIGNMLDNHNRLNDIEGGSQNLRSAAQLFTDKGKALKQKIKRRNRIMMIVVGVIIFFFILILIIYFS